MDLFAQFLATLKIDQVAYAGIVVFIIGLILTSKLQWHTVADKWEAAYFRMEESNRLLMRQNSDLIEATRTTEKVVNSLPSVGGNDVGT